MGDKKSSDNPPPEGGPTVPKGSEPSLQWAYEPTDDESWAPDDDLASEVERYQAKKDIEDEDSADEDSADEDSADGNIEEVELDAAAPPGPPPKKSERPASARSGLPEPRSMRRPALKRRHTVKLPFRQFPPRVVSDLMTRKLIAIGGEESLQSIEDGMKEYRVRHFPVVDRDNKLLGLVSYTDVMLASSSSMSAERERRDVLIHKAVKAKDVMQRDIMTVRHDEDILDAGNVMMLKHLSCLVVTDEHNTLIGILTEHDFVKAALDFLEAL